MNAYLTLLWALMVPLALYTKWYELIAFVSVISIYANLAGHLAAWQSSRVEELVEELRELMDQLESVDKKA